MLDISEYLERTAEIKLPGMTLHVYESTHSMYIDALKAEENTDVNDFIDSQLKTVVAMLNRNKEEIKVKESEIGNLPRSFVVAVYRSMMELCSKSLNDPN